MHRWIFVLALLLGCTSAIAGEDAASATPVAPTPGDDLAAMNAVSKAWDRYATLTSKDDPAGVALFSASGLKHYEFLRDAALAGSAEQVRRIPLADRVVLYALRATQTEAQLAAFDGAGIVRLCLREGWCGVPEADDGEALPSLSHVTVLGGNRAIGEFGPPTGTQFQFGPELVLEDGTWKVMPESLVVDGSVEMQRQIQQSGRSETDVLQFVLADFLGEKREVPALATLDRPLRDDAAARTRLNESWPKYEETYRVRVQAVEKKAADGDALAQFALGAILYSGKAPQLAAQDKTRGLTLLEQASTGGNAQAAGLVVTELLGGDDLPRDKPIAPERLARALPHLRRAANDGQVMAMSALSSFHFNGAAGLSRDCKQAEEWAARAEDGGWETARNDRAWTLAVCPIAEQRDPPRALALAAHMIANADTLSAPELDTVAAVLAANARYDEAVDYQKRALAKTDKDFSPKMRRDWEARLKLYGNRRDWVQAYNAYEEYP